MITLNDIKKLKNNDGITLKKYEGITYKTGYQVATKGVEVKTPEECMEAINNYNGNCGVWYSEGVYYVDKSHRVATKKNALAEGREHKQISILQWANMGLIYC